MPYTKNDPVGRNCGIPTVQLPEYSTYKYNFIPDCNNSLCNGS
jgi:hypothetical protein